MAHGLSCSAACEIFLEEGSNPCPLHWQLDSYPLDHQGNPMQVFLKQMLIIISEDTQHAPGTVLSMGVITLRKQSLYTRGVCLHSSVCGTVCQMIR